MTPLGRPQSPIGFAEVPDFHVSVARRAQPALAHRSVVVGGDPLKRGKVLASSDDLGTLGIGAGMLLSEALDRAPAAVWVQTDMALAREVSGILRAVLRGELEAVELDGLGAFYWEAAEQRADCLALADRLTARVRDEADLPLRVGFATVRFAARWAAEDASTGGTQMLAAEELDAYLLRQPIERFPGVGPKTAARLAELGASDVRSLRALGRERLEVLLGNHGRALWMLACGEDPKPLRVKRHPSTLSREKSLSESERDVAGVDDQLGRLAAGLAAALRREGLGAGRIALRLTGEDTRKQTRSQTLPEVVFSTEDLSRAARLLWERSGVDAAGIRKIGLIVAGLEIQGAEDKQLGLF